MVQELEERAAVAELANAVAARRRERRDRSAAAYCAQQRRQWCEGGITASKDVLWAQSVIDTAVGKVLGSTDGSGAPTSTVAGGGLPPSKRSESALNGKVRLLYCLSHCPVSLYKVLHLQAVM